MQETTTINDNSSITIQQIEIINTSMNYILLIIVAVILSYESLCIQKKQLICQITPTEACACLPNVFPIQLTSNLLTLIAVIYFYCIAKQTKNSPVVDCKTKCSNNINYISSLLVLIAAILRLYNLIYQNSNK